MNKTRSFCLDYLVMSSAGLVLHCDIRLSLIYDESMSFAV